MRILRAICSTNRTPERFSVFELGDRYDDVYVDNIKELREMAKLVKIKQGMNEEWFDFKVDSDNKFVEFV